MLISSKIKTLVSPLVIAVFLGVTISSNANATTTGHSLPPEPGLQNNTTLEGVDIDLDGIRDDIQIFIENAQNMSPDAINSIKKLSKLERTQIMSLGSGEKVRSLQLKISRINMCYRKKYADKVQEIKFLEAHGDMTYNTNDRMNAIFEIQSKLGGVYSHEELSLNCE